tara:strand:- start:551 stop:1048 length:498 start_codon:yes stop_codon:yes gene_type:complete
MNTFFNYSVNDDYETPIEYWKCIEPLIPKDLKINDCFYMNGNAKKKWKKLGRNIIHEKKDFYEIKKNKKKEIYVSNPPHHKFHLLLEHLFYLDKPFIMLIPINRIAYIKTQKILNKYDIQIIPSPVYTGFITADGIKTPNSPQYYCYLCWKLNLEKDLLFLNLNK